MFQSMKLRTKLSLPVIIMGLGIALISGLTYLSTERLIQASQALASDYLPSTSAVLNADRDLYQALTAQQAFLGALVSGKDNETYLNDFNENVQQARDRMHKFGDHIDTPQAAAIMAQFDGRFQDWLSAAQGVFATARAGNTSQAWQDLNGPVAQKFSDLRELYNSAGEIADKAAVSRASSAADDGRSSQRSSATVAILVLIISAMLVVMVTRRILVAVAQLQSQLQDMAQGAGDLTARVPVVSDDELGAVAAQFNRVLENLQQMIQEVKQLSESLQTGAGQLQDSARDNRAGIAQQASAIDMVATAVNEMQSAIHQVAQDAASEAEQTRSMQSHSEHAASIIDRSDQQIKALSVQLERSVTVIRKLEEDSHNIVSVLDVIRGIAEQTNLLALNAAIEAARAGEQGRGFAVVADEVRTLASRTQQSTQDIQSMIGKLTEGVNQAVTTMDEGSALAGKTVTQSEEARTALSSILKAISQINEMTISIASATEEQSQVIEDLNRNITLVNDQSQESDSRSRQISDVSNDLANSASRLHQQVSRFQV